MSDGVTTPSTHQGHDPVNPSVMTPLTHHGHDPVNPSRSRLPSAHQGHNTVNPSRSRPCQPIKVTTPSTHQHVLILSCFILSEVSRQLRVRVGRLGGWVATPSDDQANRDEDKQAEEDRARDAADERHG